MDITQDELLNGIVKITLDGDLDVAGSATADERLSGLGANKVIVDLAKVGFVASSGIRVLVKTAKALAEKGGDFAILNPNDAARRVMFTTGLDKIVTIAEDETAAVAAMS